MVLIHNPLIMQPCYCSKRNGGTLFFGGKDVFKDHCSLALHSPSNGKAVISRSNFADVTVGSLALKQDANRRVGPVNMTAFCLTAAERRDFVTLNKLATVEDRWDMNVGLKLHAVTAWLGICQK